MKKQTKTKPTGRDTSEDQQKGTSIASGKVLPTDDALLEVFPNNPLKQVAFEIRFQRNLRVLRNIDDMHDQLGPTFTFSGREGIIFPNEPPASCYAFSHQNGNLVLKAGEDRFAVLVTRYYKFESFVAELMNRVTNFCELFHIDSFKRVGLRYVNHISIPQYQSGFLLERHVIPYVDLQRIRPAKLRQFSAELLTDNGDCKFNIRTAFILNPKLTDGTYILDLDTFVESGTALGQLHNVLETLHKQAQIEFLMHITEEYKEIMRRKT